MPQISNIAESIEAVDAGEQQLQIPEQLPVLPLRDIVIYPFMIVPLFVSREVEALVRNVRASMERATNLGKNISPEVMAIVAGLDDAGRLADLAASNLELKVEDAQSVLDIADTTSRLRRVNELLNKEIEVLTVQQEINTQARADIDRSQREFFLRQQLKAIQTELGEGNELYEEIEQYRDKILKAKMPETAEEESLRQLKKLERMHPDAAETATLRNWMEIMTDLPWSKASVDNLDLGKAEQILDEDHYGLEKVKER